MARPAKRIPIAVEDSILELTALVIDYEFRRGFFGIYEIADLSCVGLLALLVCKECWLSSRKLICYLFSRKKSFDSQAALLYFI